MKAEQTKVGIIGIGWYGAHLGIALSKKGYFVTLFEKNSDIFNGVSGKFGVRIHVGPHYPRSLATRKSCQESYKEFCQTYPQLVNNHEYSIYALGERDADNQPSKVTSKQFRRVCEEFNTWREIDIDKSGFKNLLMAMDIKEPSAVVGERLRKTFKELLKEAKVDIVYNFTVTETKKAGDHIIVTNGEHAYQFDYVINATGYQSIVPIDRPPFDMEIVYQPCLALVYIDTLSPRTEKPFSFIIMDGWFPCIMPYDDALDPSVISQRKYILTHGKWTILGSYTTSAQAQEKLSSVDEKFIQGKVKPPCEAHITHFWPEFGKRFKYVTWVSAVLAKMKTEKEFRSAVTLQHKPSGIIHVIPGKISNIFDAEREALALIRKEKILPMGNYLCAEGGTLHSASAEIKEKPKPGSRSTCELQPYKDCLPALSHLHSTDVEQKKKKRGVQFEAKRISIFENDIENFRKSHRHEKQYSPSPPGSSLQARPDPSSPKSPISPLRGINFIAEYNSKYAHCKQVHKQVPLDGITLGI